MTRMGGDCKMVEKCRIPLGTYIEANTNKDVRRIVEDMKVGVKCIIEGLSV